MKLAFDSRQPRSSFHAPKVSGAPKAAGVNDENPTEVDVWTFFSPSVLGNVGSWLHNQEWDPRPYTGSVAEF